MDPKRVLIRILLAASLLTLAAIACGLPSFEQIDAARDTAAAVATKVQQGKELLATGQAAATQVLGSSAVQTARALVTEQGPILLETAKAFATQNAPLLETAKAIATEQGPSMLETAQAAATQAPSLLATLEAAATEQGPEAAATAAALVTEMSAKTGVLPADIPVMSDARDLFASEVTVTYYTSSSFQNALNFHNGGMPANGWKKDEQASYTGSETALLVFTKDGRHATVSLTFSQSNNSTFVAIGIQ